MKLPFLSKKRTDAQAKKPSKLSGGGNGKTVIEYLPDADEIERTPVPRFAQYTIQLLAIAIVSFITWASISELDQVVVAQGKLINPLPNVVVQPMETAVILSVDVRTGQVVKKGEQLASLDATFAKADEEQLRVRLESLETQIKSIERELKGEELPPKAVSGTASAGGDAQLQANLANERRANYRAQQARFAESAARLRASLATNRNDQQLVAARLRSLKEIEQMQEKMVAQKYSAPLQLLEAQQRTKEVQRELELTLNREQEIRRELAAFEAEKTAFERNWRQRALEEMLATSRERDGILQQLQKADRRSQLITLQSPVDGVVLEIAKLSPGSIVREAETFFTIVPLSAPLEAEVQIASMDVGYIRPGHATHVKLDAFPFQRHGMLDGKVRIVSEDAFKRDPNSKGAADVYYSARIILENRELKNMLEGSRLMPGMTLNAEIVVGKRSVMSYLAWPLTKGLDEAVREPK